ncbi:hypothetical protein CEXT_503311 [Caerostris extrusa]|uniref:Uncharacterized protein n=1 Tax=Caerostris extrusa TaxID=172846 RepID=A0AAV4NZP1_CAEEX|nr:hypothetical protein CEXT_503311 [Caerostris extrusa]
MDDTQMKDKTMEDGNAGGEMVNFASAETSSVDVAFKTSRLQRGWLRKGKKKKPLTFYPKLRAVFRQTAREFLHEDQRWENTLLNYQWRLEIQVWGSNGEA